MAENVLQEFLVSLGWKVDGAGEQKFKAAVRTAATEANLLSIAIEETAKAVSKYLADIVRSFDTLYFVSQRTGASIQNIKGLSYAFEQVGSTGGQAVGALESFAQAMRTNPGVGGFVQSLGVATTASGKARDSFDVLNDAIDRIKKTNPYATGAQYASLLGISESQFFTFSRYGKELQAAKEEHDRITKAFGLNNEDAGKSAARFANALRTANTIVSVAFDKLGSIALPVLEKMTSGIRNWVETHPETIERVFRAVGDAGQVAATAFWAVVNAVRAWVEAHPQEVEAVLNAIAKASEWASKAFGYLYDQGSALFGFLSAKAEEMNRDGSFLKTWEKISAAFDRTVTAIRTVLKWLNELDRATDTSAGLNAIKKFLGWVEGKTSGFANEGVAAAGRLDQATDTGIGVPAEQQAARAKETRGGVFARAKHAVAKRLGLGDRSGGVAANPGAYKDVLDHIARSEGTASQEGGGYNTSLGYGRFLPGGKEQNLTGKTLDEILALGNEMRRQPGNPNSSALGRYQIVGSTLRDQMGKLGLKGSDLFDEKTQDRIAANLARQRGADPAGLRQEWASLTGSRNATAVALMGKVDRSASTIPLASGQRGADGAPAPTDGRGVNEQLMRVIKRGQELSEIPFHVHEGLRTLERQQEMVARGWSKTMDSEHLKGRAVDVRANGDPAVGALDEGKYKKIQTALKKASAELGVPIEWGGDWKGFKDVPHFQLPKDYKAGTDRYAGDPPKPKIELPPGAMTPGGFDVNKLTSAPPMGSSSVSNTTNNGGVVNQTNHTKVEIRESSDPKVHADQFEKSITRTNQLHLENAQASVR